MTRKPKAPPVLCEGWDGTGCPRPGCPGDASPQVVIRPGAAPVVRTLCHWCWMDERSTFVLPCSACGGVPDYVRHHSHWWHLYSPHGMHGDCCARCLRPLPGACSDCCFGGEGWTALTGGYLPDAPGECACWRDSFAHADGRERAITNAPLSADRAEALAIYTARQRDERRAAVPQQTLDMDEADDDDDTPRGALVYPEAPDDDDEPATTPAPKTPAFAQQLDMFGAAPAIACPHCGRRPVYSEGIDEASAERRAYTCDNCRRAWSVDGAQLDLFSRTTDSDAPDLRAPQQELAL